MACVKSPNERETAKLFHTGHVQRKTGFGRFFSIQKLTEIYTCIEIHETKG